MLSLARNQETIYYALYAGTTESTDADGLYTGDLENTYQTPVAIEASVSAARGLAEMDLFGVDVVYTNAVIVDDISCPIDEHSVLWIGIPTTAPHNYEVIRVARSLNHITYAVQQVDCSSPDNFVASA